MNSTATYNVRLILPTLASVILTCSLLVMKFKIDSLKVDVKENILLSRGPCNTLLLNENLIRAFFFFFSILSLRAGQSVVQNSIAGRTDHNRGVYFDA